jgi:phosphohistidine phosphatase
VKLFLLRHADALTGPNDKERPLSPEGEETIRLLAKHLARHHRKLPSTFYHSSLLRARQSAEILAANLPGEHHCQKMSGITPYDTQDRVAKAVQDGAEEHLLVGHEPHLGQLASLLVCGDSEAGAFEVKKASLICLEHQIRIAPSHGAFSRWVVKWMLTPALYR